MKMKNSQKGFTLIELAIVMLIISIIIAAVASSRGIVQRANLASARQMTANAPVIHIGGLALWLETSLTDSTVLNSSNTVTKWNDISGNGRDLATDTGTPLFSYNGNIFKGIPVIVFTGSESLANSTPIASKRHTVFIVARVSDDSSVQALFTNGDVWGVARAAGSSGNISFYYGSSSYKSIAQHDDQGGVFVTKYDGTTAEGKINDSSWTLTSGTTVSFPDSGEIIVGGTNMADTEIAEIIVYNRDLFDSEIDDVVEYLMKKYNLN